MSHGGWSCTVKISSSKQAITSADNDGTGFHFFVFFSSELQPWFTGTAMSDHIAWGELLGPTQDGGQSYYICQKCFSLICGKLGFCWPSHIIPVRFYLFNLSGCLLWKTTHCTIFIIFFCRVPCLSATELFEVFVNIELWCRHSSNSRLLGTKLHLALSFAQCKERIN